MLFIARTAIIVLLYIYQASIMSIALCGYKRRGRKLLLISISVVGCAVMQIGKSEPQYSVLKGDQIKLCKMPYTMVI